MQISVPDAVWVTGQVGLPVLVWRGPSRAAFGMERKGWHVEHQTSRSSLNMSHHKRGLHAAACVSVVVVRTVPRSRCRLNCSCVKGGATVDTPDGASSCYCRRLNDICLVCWGQTSQDCQQRW